jgi:hypothetical protein|tara:strand:+ start:134 stop:484 length:351 start_codon:yes stop_codon:yes gene_type:complete
MNIFWKMLGVYALVLLFIIITSISTSAQVKAIHFNAEWNEANDVEWFDKISDIKKERMDIGKGDCKDKYKIAIVPTILLIKDGEEIKRYQADLSFKMLATRKEIQNDVDELLMSDY